MKRLDAYKIIDDERDYQDLKWGVSDNEKKLSEWLSYMEFHLSKAKELNNQTDILSEIRKLTALAVKVMEVYGCPPRLLHKIYKIDVSNISEDEVKNFVEKLKKAGLLKFSNHISTPSLVENLKFPCQDDCDNCDCKK